MASDTSGNARPELRYRALAAELRTAINRRDYRPGQALPSVSALIKQHGVSRQTVQSALDVLRDEGLIEGRPGAGVFVRERPTVKRLARNRLSRRERDAGRGAMMTDAAEGGFEVNVQVDVRFEPADADTADTLRIAEGDEVVVRDRIMSADGIPVQLATSRLPRAITRGTRIEDEDTGPGGTHKRLEEAAYVLDHGTELVKCRPATVEEAKLLRLQPGAPVLEVVRVVTTTEGLPVEVNRMVLAGERYELVYEIDMG